jgi:phenylacetate-CoA ligase
MNSKLLLPGYNSAKTLLSDLKTKPEKFWLKRGELKLLKLFKQASRQIPAYKKFLKVRRIDPKKIAGLKGMSSLPPVDKNNYLRKFPLEDLCWNGNFKLKHWTFAATSGSTGQPFYFPRTAEQDSQYAALAELYLVHNFQINKKSTLYINGFAMGVWIGGVFTYQAIRDVAERGNYNISIINPGLNKQEIIKAVINLGPKFDQIIIGGYPPFIKETVDEGLAQGLIWKNYNLGFVFSAEPFSEKFRDHIIKITGIKNPYTGTLNHYGTADQGTLAYETPLSILIRRLALKNPKLFAAVFPEAQRLPTLAQYFPEMFYFEEQKGQLLCSAYSGLPLVRYDLKDRGGVINFSRMDEIFKLLGLNLEQETHKAGLQSSLWRLPFVYVYERSDMAVSWSGANIYPEHIREAHLHKKVSPFLSGKFTMEIVFNKHHNQVLRIHSELRKDKKTINERRLIEEIKKITIAELLKNNSEYRVLHSSNASRMAPRVVLWPYESAPHFTGKGKQRWALKTKRNK